MLTLLHQQHGHLALIRRSQTLLSRLPLFARWYAPVVLPPQHFLAPHVPSAYFAGHSTKTFCPAAEIVETSCLDTFAVSNVGHTQISSETGDPLRVLQVEETRVILQKFENLGIDEHIIRHIENRSYSSLCLFLEKINLLSKEGVAIQQVNGFLLKSGVQLHSFIEAPLERFASVLALFKSMHIPGQNLAKIFLKQPNIFDVSVSSLESKVSHLESLGMARESVGKAFEKSPRVFLLALEKWKQRLEYWRSLGISDRSICKMICDLPQVFGLNIEAKIKPLIAYFDTYGIGRDSICASIRHHPQIVCFSYENLSQKMVVLQRLGFEENSKQILRAYFQLCTLSSNLVQSRFEFLINQGFSFDEAGQMAKKFPSLLANKEESVTKKLDYLVNVLKRDKKEILTFPQYIGCSLEKRIIPRFAVLTEGGGQGGLTFDSTLSTVLACTDAVFQKRITTTRLRMKNISQVQADS